MLVLGLVLVGRLRFPSWQQRRLLYFPQTHGDDCSDEAALTTLLEIGKTVCICGRRCKEQRDRGVNDRCVDVDAGVLDNSI